VDVNGAMHKALMVAETISLHQPEIRKYLFSPTKINRTIRFFFPLVKQDEYSTIL
jgi:hypothetical protein